jgi:hypothetical protein
MLYLVHEQLAPMIIAHWYATYISLLFQLHFIDLDLGRFYLETWFLTKNHGFSLLVYWETRFVGV